MLIRRNKYFCLLMLVWLTSHSAHAQQPVLAAYPLNSPLQWYHAYVKEPTARPYTKLLYTRPNNQLMSWPNYPSTSEGVMRRLDQNKKNNQVQNTIAKDVIRSLFSKKKKVAVIPKY